jgi:hypothetical protein
MQGFSVALGRRDAGQARRAGDLAQREPFGAGGEDRPKDLARRYGQAAKAQRQAEVKHAEHLKKLAQEERDLAAESRKLSEASGRGGRLEAERELKARQTQFEIEKRSAALERKRLDMGDRAVRQTRAQLINAKKAAEIARPKNIGVGRALSEALERQSPTFSALQRARRLRELAGAGLGAESAQARNLLRSRGGVAGSVLSAAAGGGWGGGGGGGGGGFFGNVIGSAIAGGARGGVPGAFVGAGVEVIKKAVTIAGEVDDKLLQLSAARIKATSQIADNTQVAVHNLSDGANMFKDVYLDVLEEGAKFGVAPEASFEQIKKTIKSIKPVGKDAAETLKTLTNAVPRYAAALDLDSETVQQAITDNFLAFGAGASQIQKDLQDVYRTISTANQEFVDELGKAPLRMDDLSRTIFEASRRADMWQLNFREVAKSLVAVEAAATKAGMAEQRRAKMGKAVESITLGQGNMLLDVQAGASVRKKLEQRGLSQQAVAGMTTEAAVKAVQEVLPDLKEGSAQALVEALKEPGNSLAYLDKEIAEVTQGSAANQEARLESLRTLMQRAVGPRAQMNVLNSLIKMTGFQGDLQQSDMRFLRSQLMGTGKDARSMDEIKKDLEARVAAREKEAGPGVPQGAGITEMAAKSIIASTANVGVVSVETMQVKATGGALSSLLDAAIGKTASQTKTEKNLESAASKKNKSVTGRAEVLRNVQDAISSDTSEFGGNARRGIRESGDFATWWNAQPDNLKNEWISKAYGEAASTDEMKDWYMSSVNTALADQARAQIPSGLGMPFPQAPPGMTGQPLITGAAGTAAAAGLSIVPGGAGTMVLDDSGNWTGNLMLPVVLQNASKAVANAAVQQQSTTPRSGP